MLADRYEIFGLLGHGGMARVFEAVSRGALGFERRVAIKQVIPIHEGDPVARARAYRSFLDEARIAARLHHAGIVAVLNFGLVDGRPFQVLELVDGWSLAALLERARQMGRPVPSDVALALSIEVAHALAHAHEAAGADGQPLEIVHRDVKPSNVLVSKTGAVKLADFGIAYALDRVTRTTANVVKGTYGYMAPEQLLGLPVDRRADVFSFGCMLHATLAGSSPCDGLSPREIASGREIPLSPELPDDLRPVVQRALRSSVEERFASAREVAEALGVALATRLETDARSRIVTWLDGLDMPPVVPSPVPRVVLTAGSGSLGERELATTVTLDRAVAPDGPTVAEPGSRSTRVVFVVAAAIPLALAAAATAGAVFARRPTTGGHVPPTSSATSGAEPPSRELDSSPAAIEQPAAVSAPSTTSSAPAGTEPSCECVEYVGARPMRTLCFAPMPTTGCVCESSELGMLCLDAACTTQRFPAGTGACTGFRDGLPRQGVIEGCSVCYGPPQRRAGIHGKPCVGSDSDNEKGEGRWRCR